MSKRYCVRLVQTQDRDGHLHHEGEPLPPALLAALHEAGLIQVHTGLNGIPRPDRDLTTLCLDLLPPSSAGQDTKQWADQLATALTAQGYNAVPAPACLEDYSLLALQAFTSTINALGGISIDRAGVPHPMGDSQWTDLGYTYQQACQALHQEPQIAADHTIEEDPAGHDWVGRSERIPKHAVVGRHLLDEEIPDACRGKDRQLATQDHYQQAIRLGDWIRGIETGWAGRIELIYADSYQVYPDDPPTVEMMLVAMDPHSVRPDGTHDDIRVYAATDVVLYTRASSADALEFERRFQQHTGEAGQPEAGE